MDRDITLRLLTERGSILNKSEILLQYYKTTRDYDNILSYLIQEEKYVEAIQFLKEVPWDEKG
jgi:uncharacterized protein YpiB (UPF0302 family)